MAVERCSQGKVCSLSDMHNFPRRRMDSEDNAQLGQSQYVEFRKPELLLTAYSEPSNKLVVPASFICW